MQVTDNTNQYQHFFLQGYRASTLGAGGSGDNTEKVGVLIIKQGMDSAESVLNSSPVLLDDELFESVVPPDLDELQLMKVESDLAAFKTRADIVVVRGKLDLPEYQTEPPNPPPPVPERFGDVNVVRVGGASQTIFALPYGWRPRDEPGLAGRLAEAGDAGAFVPDKDRPEKMPPNFSNEFFSGGRDSSVAVLNQGDRVSYIEMAADGVTPTSFEFHLTIPTAPQLTVTQDDQPIQPQPTFEYSVDTVVLDQPTTEATFVWRAVFSWNNSYELAVLELD